MHTSTVQACHMSRKNDNKLTDYDKLTNMSIKILINACQYRLAICPEKIIIKNKLVSEVNLCSTQKKSCSRKKDSRKQPFWLITNFEDQGCIERVIRGRIFNRLKGLSHEIDFKNFDKNLQNLAYLRDAAGF